MNCTVQASKDFLFQQNINLFLAGYWCDQREADDTFTVDSSDFLLQEGRFAADTFGLGRTDRLGGSSVGGGFRLKNKIHTNLLIVTIVNFNV